MTAASVVVPAHRHGPRLVACLEALRAQEVQGDLTVILALDGDVAIPAGTAALADLVVHGPAKGPAAARNRGWRASAGDTFCSPIPTACRLPDGRRGSSRRWMPEPTE